MKNLTWILAASIAALTACGGGGSSSSATATPTATPIATVTATPTSVPTTVITPTPTAVSGTVQHGYFVDSPVQGLRYETASQSGTTGTSGEFAFVDGEEVSFYMYGAKLNTAAASVILTPADTKDVNLDYTINLLRFLQTVDTDNDSSNGITLPAVDAADAAVVIPLEIDMYEFETNQVVLDFLTKYANGRALVGVEDAVNHFNATITKYDTTILDLKGATLTARTWSSLCKDPGEGFRNVNFTVSEDGQSYTAKGDFIFGYDPKPTVDTKLGTLQCSEKASSTSGTYKLSSITSTAQVLYGGPSYTYSKMNRLMISGPNMNTSAMSYGLKSVSLIWYTPGTRTINAAQHLIKTEGATVRSPYYTLYQVYTITGGTLYTPEVTTVQ